MFGTNITVCLNSELVVFLEPLISLNRDDNDTVGCNENTTSIIHIFAEVDDIVLSHAEI